MKPYASRRPSVDSLDNAEKIEEMQALVSAIMASGVYSEGVVTAELEQAIAGIYDTHNNRQALAFSNCGAALFTAFRRLREMGHHRVVVQNNTFFATFTMAAEAGLIPVVCDIRDDDPSMSVDSMIAAAEKTRARAVCLTHVGGWIAKDYEVIADWCYAHKVVLIEDAAHCFGSVNEKGICAGDFGEVACFSFYPTKAVPGGEGGAMLTKKSSPWYDYAVPFRSYGKSYDKDGLIQYDKGFNLRMSEFDAAVLLIQIQHLDEIIDQRAASAFALQDAGFSCLLGEDGCPNYYKYPVLQQEGVRTVGKVYSLTDQILGANRRQQYLWNTPVPLENSKKWAMSHMCLPIGERTYEGMTSEEIRRELLL